MQKILTAVINIEDNSIVWLPVDDRLVSRYLTKHSKLDIMTIHDNDYKRVASISGLKVGSPHNNQNFLIDWVRSQPIKDNEKLNDEALFMLYENMSFDGNCLPDIMINIEATLERWHANSVDALATTFDINTKNMGESELQDCVIDYIHDSPTLMFECVVSEGDDYLVVYSDIAGAHDRAPASKNKLRKTAA